MRKTIAMAILAALSFGSVYAVTGTTGKTITAPSDTVKKRTVKVKSDGSKVKEKTDTSKVKRKVKLKDDGTAKTKVKEKGKG